jgi:hypothetical protein
LFWWLIIVIALITTPIVWAEPAAAPASPIAVDVRISQVYGGGGLAGAPYRNDFIELFNAGATAVDLTGWSVQYGAALGATWTLTPLSGSIPPGGYYLISEAASGGCGGTACGVQLPQVNVSGQINLGTQTGKVMLVSSMADHVGSCPSDSAIVDLVGYGASATCAEGAPAPATTNATAVIRAGDGCTDTGDNAADFTAAAPAPRNASTPQGSCSALAVELSAFTAQVQGNGVALAWETVSERHNAGFNIYRGGAESGPWRRVNAALVPAAAPGATGGHAYRFTDLAVSHGASYWYVLEAVDLDGRATQHGPVTVEVLAPNAVTLRTARATSQPGSTVGICAVFGLVAAGGLAWRARQRRKS